MKDQILRYLPEDHPWKDQISWFDTIDSTNTRAKAMALAGAPHGSVLIADRQTSGRGRLGRTFLSPGGCGIYMSAILRYACPPIELMHLTCAVGTAMCDAVACAAGVRPGIKWINDLVIGKKKLAGILVELVTVPGEVCAIVGIGINCCQKAEDFDPAIRDTACSLLSATGKMPDRAALAANMVVALRRMDETLFTGKAAMLDAYRRGCVTLGQEISLVRGDEVRHGTAVDMDDEGALLVHFCDGHTETVNSGEVSVRGMYGYIS